MISPEQKEALKGIIQQNRTSQYMSSYLAGLGANIHLGEKRARQLGRQAGCVAMKFADRDLALDHEEFAAACQQSYDEAMLAVANAIDKPEPTLLVPERFAGGNGKVVGS